MSLSLNVPGFPKSNATVKAFFDFVLRDLKYNLKAHLIEINHPDSIETCDAAGDFFIVPILNTNLHSLEIKQICESFEENHPLGRFIDVDLNDARGDTISSGKSKLCFFCNEKAAIDCRRENAHDHEQLRQFMFSKMAEYCHQHRDVTISNQLSSLALKALLYEISLSPKPGLVDKFSNGSHADMNYQMFVDSSVAISPWFFALVYAGFAFDGIDYIKALPVIRRIGLRMESAMYEATGNVNTQKGIIFLMGLSLFACGRLYRESDRFDMVRFRDLTKAICKDLVTNELVNLFKPDKSHGEAIFQQHGFSGARGEAESGFQTVFEFGLPQLAGIEKLTDEAQIKCFLSIASTNADTNILYRRGTAVLSRFQELCKKALADFTDSNYSAVIDYCRIENISPGGSADLLAVTIFVWSVMNADEQKIFTPKISENDF